MNKILFIYYETQFNQIMIEPKPAKAKKVEKLKLLITNSIQSLHQLVREH